MRTTLTIDNALLRQLRQKALDSGRPFKQVVNDTLRAGLEKSSEAVRPHYACPAFSMGQPRWPVNLDKALALAAELEDRELVTKLRQGRRSLPTPTCCSTPCTPTCPPMPQPGAGWS